MFVKLSAGRSLPNAIRTYATRRPERPPPKIKDPLSVAPNATHYNVAPNLTFIHRPPPSAPSPYSLTTAPASPLLNPLKATITLAVSQESSPSSLPPPLWRKPKGSQKMVNQEQIEQMRRLRVMNPQKWTQKKLAEEFGCSTNFVGIAAPLPKALQKSALASRDEEHEARRARWGERKSTFVAIRQKRKTLW